VRITTQELAARLADADRIRALLWKATREWRKLGQILLERRRDGSGRPHNIDALARETPGHDVRARFDDIRRRALRAGPGPAG